MTAPMPPSERDEHQAQQKWYERTRYQVLLFAGGIALFVLVAGWVLDWYIEPKTSGERKDLVQALGLITAGVAGAVGIYFTWRGQRLARKAQEENQKTTQAQLENARNELDIARRGQITERFTQAIDQLGSNSLEIRLGGIYSLERTARDSRSDHWPVMEVLTAYVRNHAPWKLEKESAEVNVPTHEPDIPRRVNTIDRQPEHMLASDIQAILTVIGRRLEYHRRGTFEDGKKIEYGPIDLHNTDLRGAHLGLAHLEESRLYGAHLEGALLRAAYLEGARLDGAHLEGARLERARMQGAYLQGAHLGGALLRAVHLEEAHLEEAHLEEAHLERARMQGAYLVGAHLERAHLERAHLEGAYLQGAYLAGAHLRGAYLLDAHVEGAMGLEAKQLEWTVGNENTELPEYLVDSRPTAWSKSIEEQIALLGANSNGLSRGQ